MNQINEPLKSPTVVYHNSRVAVGKDLVFNWVVLTVPEDSPQATWTPAEQLPLDKLREVQRLMDENPTFPVEFRSWLRAKINGELAVTPHATPLQGKH